MKTLFLAFLVNILFACQLFAGEILITADKAVIPSNSTATKAQIESSVQKHPADVIEFDAADEGAFVEFDFYVPEGSSRYGWGVAVEWTTDSTDTTKQWCFDYSSLVFLDGGTADAAFIMNGLSNPDLNQNTSANQYWMWASGQSTFSLWTSAGAGCGASNCQGFRGKFRLRNYQCGSSPIPTGSDIRIKSLRLTYS